MYVFVFYFFFLFHLNFNKIVGFFFVNKTKINGFPEAGGLTHKPKHFSFWNRIRNKKYKNRNMMSRCSVLNEIFQTNFLHNANTSTYQWFIAFHQLYYFNSFLVLIHLDRYVRQMWIKVFLCYCIMCSQ